MDPFKRTDIRKHGIGVYALFTLISSCGQSYELGMFDVPVFFKKTNCASKISCTYVVDRSIIFLLRYPTASRVNYFSRKRSMNSTL